MAITVGLINHHPSMTDTMSLLLSNSALSIDTSYAHSYEDAGQLIAQDHCDIYLIDMNLGKDVSLDLINFIASKNKPSIVLLEQGDISLIKKAIKVGSKGYLSKTSVSVAIHAAISQVLDGKTFFDEIEHPTIDESMGLYDDVLMRA